MKAEIVFNTVNEPRLLLTFETAEERVQFKNLPNLEFIRVGANAETGAFLDMAFELIEEWVIEFRNGGLFQDLETDHGGPLETAAKFRSKQAAEVFMSANSWIYANGGMAILATAVQA